MNTPQHPSAPEPAALTASTEPAHATPAEGAANAAGADAATAEAAAPESFSGWLVSSVELFCGMTVTHLGIDPTQPGWREVFGLAALP